MKQSKLKYIKPFSFLPALLMMCLIFSFSAQNGETSGSLSHEISRQIIEIGGNTLLHKNLDEKKIDQLADRIEFPIRKLAHMSEYLILCLSVSLPLYVYGMRGKMLFFTALIISAAFAATDEYHQSFVAGRGPSVRDVFIDSAGAFLGALLVRFLCRKRPRRKN